MLKKIINCCLFIAIIFLSGCAAQKKEIADTFPSQILPVYIKTGPQVNGGNSPLYVVIYQLKTTLPFADMNFETLSKSAYQSLGSSYVNSTEYYFVPNEQKILKLQLRPGVQYIGIFADYKNMNLVKWREIVSLNSLKKNQFSVQFTTKGISLVNNSKQ